MTHCNDYCPDDNNKSHDIKPHLYDTNDAAQSTSHKDSVLNSNFKNDDNNNNNTNNNTTIINNQSENSRHNNSNVNILSGKDKDVVDNVDLEQEIALNHTTIVSPHNSLSDNVVKTTDNTSRKVDKVTTDSPTNCISQFLNTIINFRRDEMTLNLNNLLTGANQTSTTSTTVSMQQPPVTANGNNMLINDMNRSFMSSNSFNSEHTLSSLISGHQQYSKYGRGACKWPGCDLIFDDLQTFTK